MCSDTKAYHNASLVTSSPVLTTQIAKFPWDKAVEALDSDATAATVYFQKLLDTLVPYLIMPPPDDDQRKDCQAPLSTIDLRENINCKDYPTAFTGTQRKAR